MPLHYDECLSFCIVLQQQFQAFTRAVPKSLFILLNRIIFYQSEQSVSCQFFLSVPLLLCLVLILFFLHIKIVRCYCFGNDDDEEGINEIRINMGIHVVHENDDDDDKYRFDSVPFHFINS